MMNENKEEKKESQTTGSATGALLDDVLVQIGYPGPYYVIVYLMLFLFNAFAAFNHISLPATMGITPDHRCTESRRYIEDLNLPLNTSLKELKFEECDVTWKRDPRRKVPCKGWTYEQIEDTDISSIVTKWDLVCGKKFYPMLSTTIYFVGVMIGGGTIGHVSDHYGRRPVLLTCLLLSIILLTIVPLVPYYELFTAIRFVAGIFVCGFHSTLYVITPEISPKKYSGKLGLCLVFSFVSSVASGALVCWLTKSYWKAQLYLTVPMVALFVMAYFMMPESFRWLVLHKKKALLHGYLTRAATVNRRQLPPITVLRSGNTIKKPSAYNKTKYTVCEIFRFKEIRRRMLAVFFVWLALAVAYYGLSFNVRTINSSPYLSVVTAAAFDLIPLVLAFFLINRVGKRRIILSSVFLGGLFSITYKFYNHLAIMIVGKMFAGTSFGLIFVYCADLFPTVVRNICLGLCVTVSRLGSVIAPQVVLLGSYTSPDVPVLLSGVLMLLVLIIVFFMPETSRLPIPDTIEDVEHYKEIKKEISVTENMYVVDTSNSYPAGTKW